MKPDARITPRSLIVRPRSPPVRSARRSTLCAMKPPTSAGRFSSSGRYIPSAKVSGETLSSSIITAIMAPTPNSIQATGCWLMKPCTSAFMIEACGAARIGRVSPAACSPNWKLTARITIASPTASADASTPRNFTFSCAAGVDPSQ